MYWLSNAILVYDNLTFLLPFTLIGLPLVLSIFYGLMQILNLYFWSFNSWRIIYFSIFWTIFEIIRSLILTGLPWNIIAYSWTWSIYVMQSLSLFGVYGLCLITILISASLFSFKLNKTSFLLSLTAFIILLILFFY
mgnify:CR=1 FL=1